MLYTIGFGEHTSEGFRKTLAEFAEASGGRAFFPRRAQDLDRTFDAILDELSHQYILSYVSTATAPGTWRRLEIRSHRNSGGQLAPAGHCVPSLLS